MILYNDIVSIESGVYKKYGTNYHLIYQEAGCNYRCTCIIVPTVFCHNPRRGGRGKKGIVTKHRKITVRVVIVLLLPSTKIGKNTPAARSKILSKLIFASSA